MGGDATIYREVQDSILEHLSALDPNDLEHLMDLAGQVDVEEMEEGLDSPPGVVG